MEAKVPCLFLSADTNDSLNVGVGESRGSGWLIVRVVEWELGGVSSPCRYRVPTRYMVGETATRIAPAVAGVVLFMSSSWVCMLFTLVMAAGVALVRRNADWAALQDMPVSLPHARLHPKSAGRICTDKSLYEQRRPRTIPMDESGPASRLRGSYSWVPMAKRTEPSSVNWASSTLSSSAMAAFSSR